MLYKVASKSHMGCGDDDVRNKETKCSLGAGTGCVQLGF